MGIQLKRQPHHVRGGPVEARSRRPTIFFEWSTHSSRCCLEKMFTDASNKFNSLRFQLHQHGLWKRRLNSWVSSFVIEIHHEFEFGLKRKKIAVFRLKTISIHSNLFTRLTLHMQVHVHGHSLQLRGDLNWISSIFTTLQRAAIFRVVFAICWGLVAMLLVRVLVSGFMCLGSCACARAY